MSISCQIWVDTKVSKVPFLYGNLKICDVFLKIDPLTTLPKFGKPIFLFWTLEHYQRYAKKYILG